MSPPTAPQVFTNTPPLQEIQAPIPAPANASFTFSVPGIYWFACPVAGHCPAGMIVRFAVS